MGFSWQDLKQKILQTLTPRADGSKIVLNQFCTALSAYIVHMLPQLPAEIEDVITKVQTQQIPNDDSQKRYRIMIEVLTAMPEEAMKVLTSVRRAALQNEINNKIPFVIKILENYLEQEVAKEWTEDHFYDFIGELEQEMSEAIKFANATKPAGFYSSGIPEKNYTCKITVKFHLLLYNKDN